MRPAAQLRESTEQSILEWIRSHGHALAATDPTPDDLRSLATALGSPRVIGIGEITHGTHEDLAVKSAPIRAPIERGDLDCPENGRARVGKEGVRSCRDRGARAN